MIRFKLLVISLAVLAFVANANSIRINRVLDNGWEGAWIEGNSPEFPEFTEGWMPVTLPLCKGGYSLLLRRTLDIPKQWCNKQIVLTGK